MCIRSLGCPDQTTYKYCETIVPHGMFWGTTVSHGVEYRIPLQFFFIQKFYDSFTGGKRDEKLILPLNSSVSVTLSQEEVW